MKRLGLLMLIILFPLALAAQQVSYNKRGDEAMKRQDYSDAKMWYEEGVAQCDAYSIRMLTKIWRTEARMRPSMRSLMNKCLNCLNVMATENDTIAVQQLITYYQEGIGTPKSEELATYWLDRMESLRKPPEPVLPVEPERVPMRFFVGYSFSPTAPYGLSFGGIGQRMGWYARFKTNMSFQSSEKGSITEFAQNASYQYVEKQANTYAGTVGMLVRCNAWLYASAGVGYGNHDLAYRYRVVAWDDSDRITDVWCKQNDDSFKGVAAEADLLFKIGAAFVSVGCNTINFKYIDLNAGVGIFF